MNRLTSRFVFCLLLFAFAVSGCSGSKDSGQNKESSKTTVQQQATEAIRDYGKRPMDAAKEAQQMGNARTKAIDETLKHQ